MTQEISKFIGSYCSSLSGCLQGLYNFLVAIAVLVAFVMFLIGAFKNLISVVPDVKMEGKRQMKNAIIGLIVIFVSGVFLYWINPNIFNAKLMIYKIEDLNLGSVTIYMAEEVNRILQRGEGRVLSFSSENRCKDFFTAIDELVDAGVGVSTYNLTDYKLENRELTPNQVKVLLKALLQTESGGHGCNPKNWGRGNYAFATFGIEWGSISCGTRSKNNPECERRAFQKVAEEARIVYANLPPGIKNKINLQDTDFNVNNIGVERKLDNPYLISAVAIKRLSSYKTRYNINNDLIKALCIWKAGKTELSEVYKEGAKAIANIIATIKRTS